MHERELIRSTTVHGTELPLLARYAVPGGWLYVTHDFVVATDGRVTSSCISSTFVPDPEATKEQR